MPDTVSWPTDTRRPKTEAAGRIPVRAARIRKRTERIPNVLEARNRKLEYLIELNI